MIIKIDKGRALTYAPLPEQLIYIIQDIGTRLVASKVKITLEKWKNTRHQWGEKF